jgi:bla regulator protein BlaR1
MMTELQSSFGTGAFGTGAGPAIANHLWQSTVFVAVVWLLTRLLRSNQAQVRYGLWLAASVKFLVPFSLLIGLGSLLPRPQRSVITPQPGLYSTMDVVAQPFSGSAMPASHTLQAASLLEHLSASLPIALASVWLCGAVTVLLVWWARWRQASATLRRAVPAEDSREVKILRRLEETTRSRRPVSLLLSREMMEPGIFGIFRPVLLWPMRLSELLEDEHIEAILVHERTHAQRRDNLAALLHMLVEAIFWFHPIVWWIERRMVEEREHACDEAVVQMRGRPEIYAESLLKACRFCVESPLTCVSGITGAGLNRRIVSIMTAGLGNRLSRARKLLLAAVGAAFVVGPFAIGLVNVVTLHAQLLHPANGTLPSFEVATIKPNHSGGMNRGFRIMPAELKIENASVTDLIKFAYGIKSNAQLSKGPGWIDSDKFDIDAKIEESQVEAIKKLSPNQLPDQERLMLQSLLADRFGLKLTSQTKELPVYALVVAKGGPKLKEAEVFSPPQSEQLPPPSPGEPRRKPGTHLPTLMGRPGKLEAGEVPMPFFTDWLSRQPEMADRVVIDATGLKGRYDLELTWTPDNGQPNLLNGAPQENTGPSIFTALQEQLGLKLEPQKAPVETLVIDHIERPSEN